MPQVWEDGERLFRRRWRLDADGNRSAVLVVQFAAEHPPPASLARLAHEYGLRDELDSSWAVRPLELGSERGRSVLVLEDPGGEPLDRLLGAPMEVGRFLPLAIGIVVAVGKLHQRGLIHRDLKPANIVVNCPDGQVRLTGFGLASRLQRERQSLGPPETIAGTLAYMAPEQTGRMNRSVDSRSDLYSLGATLYQILTNHLLFAAADPMEWVHCHIASKPVPPGKRRKEIPGAISAIIMKLLAKTPEDRYQSAAGLEIDLRRCLAAWETERRIDAFPLGEHDTAGRLLIPEKLYGRADEVDALLAAFDRIVKGGAPELVLVSGYSGIGKSSLVNELHRVLVQPRGLFASGKFDQYKRDIPYSTLVQAFQNIVRSILVKSDAELARWRDALLEAFGPNGRLMVDLIPELKFIIGEQPPVLELEPQQAQKRFQLVFRRLIGVFASPEHPLALFLDDLQWLDAATLDLLEDLLTRPDVRHLMLIGAYRDNEVDFAHPLMRKLEAIRKAGAMVQDIVLAPLGREDLGQLIADSVRCEFEHSAPLAQLVHEKTNGNPFFAIQFISTLAEEGLLTFDQGNVRWCWDLDRIHARGYTDNVVDLMVGKLHRLPLETRNALQQLACIGNSAEFTLLGMLYRGSTEDMHGDLWEAVRTGLVFRSEAAYRFLHDRVQEAAYSLIPEDSRAAAHLRIGRLLAAHTPPDKREEAIFEIVNQLNRGATLITSADEREQLAEVNLIAGKRAKASTAYASALTYLAGGAAMLAEDSWVRWPDLTFALELNRAECEFQTGALTEAEQRLTALSAHAATTVERASVTCLLADLYTSLNQGSRAAAVSLDYLRHLGGEWSRHPPAEEVRREYQRIWSMLADRQIEALADLPLMSDPASLGTIDVLTRLAAPAWYMDANLASLIICRVVNLSLEGGNSDGSCYAYVVLGLIAGSRFGDYQAGFRFGRLGCDLVEQHGLKHFQARTYVIFGSVVLPWTRHVRAGRDLIRHAFEAANKIGDLTFAGYCCNHLNTNLLAAGDPLDEVQGEAERGLAFTQKIRFGLALDAIVAQLGLVRSLRGLTPKFGCLDDERFAELEMERRFSANPDLTGPESMYWPRKLQARFFAGDYAAALEAAERAQRVIWSSPSHFETAEYEFYGALVQAASWDSAAASQRRQHAEVLGAHHRQLEIWAANCPENFENRAALVGAEIARIEGRDADAMRLYEQAISSARSNGFVHNEAIAYERASAFYRARGFDQFAELYLRNARYSYLRWGAHGKVRQLDELYPRLRTEEPAPAPTSTIGAAPVEHLDLATVIKVSQTVSGEMVLEKLLDTLMRTAIAHAGAERGLLVDTRGAEPRTAAEATTSGDAVLVQLRDEPLAADLLPESVLHYVLRTGEGVTVDDATAHPQFAADRYVRQRQARSILCLPLITQAKLIGVLYLENNLAPRVFAPARIAVLKLLAAQAAISLENSRLYRDLAEREAKIRHLVDANIIGIYVADFEGQIFEANGAFLRIVGYDREDLAAGRLHLDDLTPSEWRDRTAQAQSELKMTGAVQPYEKEYFRKDGSRVPVLLGAAAFDETENQSVIFVLDLTERKRAEAEAHESERRYREVQMELAHANRVATMGELTASIAHDVNQPIAATVINAQTGLRILDGQMPDLEEVRQVLASIVKDGNRAGEVIGRIRALIKRAPAQDDRLELNEAILEIVALTRAEVVKNGVTVQTELADGLPSIQGDRVELQQVLLNLIINAVEAMSSAGEGVRELLISTGHAELGGVLVSVHDSGPGLAPSNLEHLFRAFYTTKPSGLGLGLSICRSIIEARGGRLWATANLPHGAVFQFTLPAYPDLAM
ncbi:AAA family ATPase [Mesorhizobium sp. M0622]|uniref:trifunctional serine/threonine-protein kinase/ATP-binding protein/sensor histidine kinase n=1 Tax=Mesorhizobium sp. M0622 TaxID=2956975 RepID=UPI00333AB28E